MGLPSSLSVALKEWAIVCAALQNGRQMVLLRKGGIYESAGEFELAHREFVLFPTYLHQNPAMLKPEMHAGLEPRTTEPEQIRLSAAAEVTDIIQLKNRSQIDAIDDQHIWTPPLIDMRFNYKPQNPLYLLLVRAYSLAEPVTIVNTPGYAGCKSWVPLEEPVAAGEAVPAIDEEKYQARRNGIVGIVSGPAK